MQPNPLIYRTEQNKILLMNRFLGHLMPSIAEMDLDKHCRSYIKHKKFSKWNIYNKLNQKTLSEKILSL